MATLNLFQIVSKQLKETTYVALEDTHKQLDMVRRSAGARWAAPAEPRWFLIGWIKGWTGQSYSSQTLTGSESPGGSGVLMGPGPEVSDSIGLRWEPMNFYFQPMNFHFPRWLMVLFWIPHFENHCIRTKTLSFQSAWAVAGIHYELIGSMQ